MTHTVLIRERAGFHPSTAQGASMALILIDEDVLQLRLLLGAVVERLGHRAMLSTDEGAAGADLLIVDPLSAGAVERTRELLRLQPSLPVVCVGLDPADPDSLGVPLAAVVPKPFTLEELGRAIEDGLRQDR